MKENRKTGMNSGCAGVLCNLLLFQKMDNNVKNEYKFGNVYIKYGIFIY